VNAGTIRTRRFHGEVHLSHRLARRPPGRPAEALRTRIARSFTTLLGHVIDQPDLNFRSYDPRDHFDTGLIDQSWRTVRFGLGIFYKKALGDAEGLVNACFAAHGIADFYAHSSYAHFLSRELGTITPYDPVTKKPALKYDYANDPGYSKATSHLLHALGTSSPISIALRPGAVAPSRAAIRCPMTHTTPSKRHQRTAHHRTADRRRQKLRRQPAHHNEIAVDEDGAHTNALYNTTQYKQQFALRYHLALRHITRSFQAHPGLQKP
jgi:hypothetical protein